MVQLLDRAGQAPAVPSDGPSVSSPRRGLIDACIVAVGAALAVLVIVDGSWGWRLLRTAAVVALTDLVLSAARPGVEPRRGRLAVVVGVVGVVVGIGFVPHLLESGLTVTAAASTVLLASGVTLLVAGTAAATRGHGWLRRLGAAVLVVLIAAVATWIAAPAIAVSNVPTSDLDAIPASVGLDVESVMVTTADGVELAGWYVPSENGAAVLVRHGSGSTRSNVLPEAAVLAEHGFGVLLLDARGHGASDGRAMDFGWYGDLDIAAGTRFLASRADVDPGQIGVLGSSMGGEEAIGAAATNDLVAAVVAEGATGRTAADKAWLSDEYGLRGTLQEQIERLQYGLTDLLTAASPPSSLRDAVNGSADTRFLLISAGTMPDEVDAAAHIAAGAPDRVDTWTVAGAGHTAGLQLAPEEWERRVVGFLQETLLPR
jgi:pimeloyl-ACP methyl ester carboxylesterase